MKTLILSDISENVNESIIPFSLRWARNMGTEAEILHIIDERETQGYYSAYSDSQTITPIVELHTDRLRKEKIKANNRLKEYLSRELSFLNYPLKLDIKITIGNFEEELRKHLNVEDTLILNCCDYNSHFDNYENMLNIIKSLPCQVLCVNENNEFKTPEKTLYVLHNDSEEDTVKKQYINNLLTNLQSYPKITSSYYAFEKEVEERPVNAKDFELFYTITPKNNKHGTKNIDSLIQALNIDLLAFEKQHRIKKVELKSLFNNNIPILFTPAYI